MDAQSAELLTSISQLTAAVPELVPVLLVFGVLRVRMDCVPAVLCDVFQLSDQALLADRLILAMPLVLSVGVFHDRLLGRLMPPPVGLWVEGSRCNRALPEPALRL